MPWRSDQAYIQHPPWQRWLQTALLVLFASFIAATGWQAHLLSGGWYLEVCGSVLLLGGGVAAVGAVTRLYNIEMIGLYLGAAGLLFASLWTASQGAVYTTYTVWCVAAAVGLRLLILARIAARVLERHLEVEGGESA